MANICTLSLLLCLLLPGALARILRRSCLHYANFSYVRSNKILEGSLLGTFSNHSPDQCEARCVHEYFCKSINVQIADPKTCQLNGDSESDASDYVTLTTKSGWTFKSTNFSEPNIGEVCKDLNPCPAGQLCFDSCQCPGYECHKCRGLSEGKTCEMYGVEIPPLGMESGQIKNYQISSSSNYNENNRAHNGRLNNTGQWRSQNLLPLSFKPYFRVDFITRKIITAIATQSHNQYANYQVTSYKLMYSEDSYAWKTYQEAGSDKIFQVLSPNKQTAVKRTLQVAVKAFAVKIYPITWGKLICMRMELYGVDDPAQPVKPAGCRNNVRPLGMSSKAIPDANITASSFYDENHRLKGRLNLYTLWGAGRDSNVAGQYLEVDLGKNMLVSAVALQGDVRWYVTKYNVMYSVDPAASTWMTVMSGSIARLFIGNMPPDEKGISKQKLDPAITARIVRITAQEFYDHICMGIELYGCDIL